MTGAEYKDNYLRYLKDTWKRDDKTITAYNRDLTEGLNILFNTNDGDFITLANKMTYIEVIQNWLMPKYDDGIKASTIKRNVSSWKSFFNYLKGLRLITYNPFDEIKPFPEKEQFEKKILTDDEIIKLLKHTQSRFDNNKNYSNCRDNLIVNVLAATGMRIHELEKINIDDINFSSGEHELIGKRKMKRTVYLNDYTLNIYREFLYYRNQLQGKPGHEEALFLSHVKQRMTIKSLERLITKLTNEVGVTNVTPHSFKHKFISDYTNNTNLSMEEIGKFTGNKNVAVMYKHYLHQGEKVDLKKLANQNPVYEKLI